MIKFSQIARRFRSKKSFFFSTVILLILLVSLPLGLYLVLNKINFFPKAAENKNPTSSWKKPEYVPGEVIVKLKKPTTGSSQFFRIKADARSQGVAFDKRTVEMSAIDPSSLPPSLQTANTRYKITAIEKVFKSSIDPQTDLNNFKKTLASGLAKDRREINDQELLKNDLSGIYKVKFSMATMNEDLNKELVRGLLTNSDFEWVEPNYVYKLFWIPNDPYFLDQYPNSVSLRDPLWNPTYDYQWDMKKIKMVEAWDVIKKGTATKVAVIDSGVDYTHPEFGGCTIVQLRQDQCLKLTSGYNFAENNDDPMDTDSGHGTHVSGTITAMANNGIGMAGMDRFGDIRVIPIRALAGGKGNLDDLAAAINYAVNHGARVVNMSWGGEGESETISSAISDGINKGVVFVAAAGNSTRDVANFFPANIDGVIAVGATDYTDRLADYSNFGSKIDVVAPGGLRSYDLLSLGGSHLQSGLEKLVVNKAYLRLAGTSMASPHVAGLAGLILTQRSNLSPKQVRNIMVNSADDLGDSGFDTTFGYGRINVFRSVTEMNTNIPTVASITSPKTSVSGKFDVLGTVDGNNFKSYQLTYSLDNGCMGGSGSFSANGVTIPNPSMPVKNGLLATINLPNTVPNGQHCLKVTVSADKPFTLLYPFTTDNAIPEGWPLTDGEFWSDEVAVADINSDGNKEILFLSGRDGLTSGHSFRAVNFSGKDSIGFPIDLASSDSGHGVAAADKRGFFISSWHRAYYTTGDMRGKILGLDGRGNPISHWSSSDWTGLDTGFTKATVTIADLDGDGKNDVIFAEDSTVVSNQAGKVYAFDENKNPLPGWEGGVVLPGTPDQNKYFVNVGLAGSPMVGDVGGGDKTPKVVVLYNIYAYYENGMKFYTPHVAVFDNKGKVLSTWSYPISDIVEWPKSAFLADIDGDGKMEIVINSNTFESAPPFYERGWKVTAWKSDGKKLWSQQIGDWPFIAPLDLGGSGGVNVLVCVMDSGACTIFDKSGNTIGQFSNNTGAGYGTAIVRLKNGDIVFFLNGAQNKDYFLTAIEYNPKTRASFVPSGFPKFVSTGGWEIMDAPIASDLNGDGGLEVITNVCTTEGRLCDGRKMYLFKTGFDYDKILWSQYQGNERHTGAYESAVSPTPILTPTPIITPTPTPTATPSGCTASCVSAVTTGSCKQGSPCKTSDQKNDPLPKVTFTVNSSGCTNGVTVDLSLGQFSSTAPINEVPAGTWWDAAKINQTGTASADWNFCNSSVCHSFSPGQTLYWRVRDTATSQSKAICSPFNAPSTGPTVTPTPTPTPVACVRATPTLTLSPSSQDGRPGDALTYNLMLTNKDSAGCSDSQFNITPFPLPSGWSQSTLPVSQPLSPGKSVTIPMTITSSSQTPPNTYGFVEMVSNSAAQNYTGYASATYRVTSTSVGCTVSCVSAVTTGTCKQGSPCKTSDQKNDPLPKVTFTVNSSGCTNGVTVDLSLGQFSATDPVNQVPWGTWWSAAQINQGGTASSDWNFCNANGCHSFSPGQTLYWRVRDTATSQSKAICSPFNAPGVSSASVQQPTVGFFPTLSNVLGASTDNESLWRRVVKLITGF